MRYLGWILVLGAATTVGQTPTKITETQTAAIPEFKMALPDPEKNYLFWFTAENEDSLCKGFMRKDGLVHSMILGHEYIQTCTNGKLGMLESKDTQWPAIASGHLVLDPVQAAKQDHPVPVCTPQSTTTCVDPSLRHITGMFYGKQDVCESEQKAICRQLPATDVGNQFWVPVGKPVFVDETPEWVTCYPDTKDMRCPDIWHGGSAAPDNETSPPPSIIHSSRQAKEAAEYEELVLDYSGDFYDNHFVPNAKDCTDREQYRELQCTRDGKCVERNKNVTSDAWCRNHIDGIGIQPSSVSAGKNRAPLYTYYTPQAGRPDPPAADEGCQEVPKWANYEDDPKPYTKIEPVTQSVLHCIDGWHVEVWHRRLGIYGYGQDMLPRFDVPDNDGYRRYIPPQAVLAGDNGTDANHPAKCVKDTVSK